MSVAAHTAGEGDSFGKWLVAVVYAVGRLSLGLLLHPYQTMFQLVQARLFSWLVLVPTLVLAVVTVSWRWLLVPGVRTVFSCAASGWVACEYLEFISNWMTFFLMYWQVLLLYLFVRFKRVLR
jgi:hypothetical protein